MLDQRSEPGIDDRGEIWQYADRPVERQALRRTEERQRPAHGDRVERQP